MTEPNVQQEQESSAWPAQIIYADRISNVAVGMSVSRLTLAADIGNNKATAFAQLVIPTPALFEVLDSIVVNLVDSADVRNGLVEAMNAFKDKLTSKEG